MNANALQITIACRDNPDCTFREKDVVVDLFIKNITDHEIGIPLRYLQRKGVFCLLTDNETNMKYELGISLTPPSLKHEFVPLKSGESITLTEKIYADFIKSIRTEMVDLTATFEVTGLVKLLAGEEPEKFIELRTIRIQGQDKIDAERIFEKNR